MDEPVAELPDQDRRPLDPTDERMMLSASASAAGVGSCPNGIADADRLGGGVGQADGERLPIGYPAHPRDPEHHSATYWIQCADRLPYAQVVEER